MSSSTLFPIEEKPLDIEKNLWKSGYIYIAGVDEVGRGALAGPVVAAAVIMKPTAENLITKVRDSKKLTAEQRESLFPLIQFHSTSYGIGIVEPGEIDQINILQATLKAMALAVEQLDPKPDLCLIDGNIKAPIPCPQRLIVKGDDRIFSIAAASVLAKVTRDRMMVELNKQYPFYIFDQNKGYGTRLHLKAIEKWGLCDQHRRSFRIPVSST